MNIYDNVKTENELFEIWKQKKPEKIEYGFDKKNKSEYFINHSNAFIEDGIINKEEFNKGKKILYLLKEAYSDGRGWDLRKRLPSEFYQYNIWKRVSEWTYGIENTNSLKIEQYKENIDKTENNEWLNKIAVVNIKKSSGKSKSDFNEILAYAYHDKEELKKQIEIIDPNIIVCGYTIKALDIIFDKSIRNRRCDNWFYYDVLAGKERLIIDYYHPANRYPALLNYYGIVNIYQQALLEKKK